VIDIIPKIIAVKISLSIWRGSVPHTEVIGPNTPHSLTLSPSYFVKYIGSLSIVLTISALEIIFLKRKEDEKMRNFLIYSIILFFFLGCATREVKRIEVESQVDLSGRWNDTDSRFVAEAMTRDVLSKRWLEEFHEKYGRKPVVIVGTIRNHTTEHINVDTFIKDIERELINSGKVKFVATRQERVEVRKERLDQQEYASEETAKRLAHETGADFILQGAIKSIEDVLEGKRVVYYQTDLELIYIETNEKVWIGSKKIKKFIKQARYKW
jgi:hypothetical protein